MVDDEAGPIQDREMLDDGLSADRELGREDRGWGPPAGDERIEQSPPGRDRPALPARSRQGLGLLSCRK
jgi:hypothetical protein